MKTGNKNNKQSRAVLKTKARAVRELIARADVVRLEREVALLFLDVLAALEVGAVSLKEADAIFTDIGYRIGPDLEKKTSEEFSMLLADAMLLDEVGEKYGPDLQDLRNFATQILTRDRSLVSFMLPRTRATA